MIRSLGPYRVRLRGSLKVTFPFPFFCLVCVWSASGLGAGSRISHNNVQLMHIAGWRFRWLDRQGLGWVARSNLSLFRSGHISKQARHFDDPTEEADQARQQVGKHRLIAYSDVFFDFFFSSRTEFIGLLHVCVVCDR